mgnify:CR=1 FL=1
MAGSLDRDLASGSHLLLVPAGVAPDAVAALAGAWFPATERLGGQALRLAPGALLTGPWVLDEPTRRALGIDQGGGNGYLLHVPRLRGALKPSDPGPGDLAAAFPDGLPYGIEAAAVTLLRALARRLGGSMRVGGTGSVVTPDAIEAVDRWVYARAWLGPEELTDVLGGVLPAFGVVVGPEGVREPGRAVTGAPGAAGAPAREYSALAELGEDGAIEVTVRRAELLPVVLRGSLGSSSGDRVVAYSVRWLRPFASRLQHPSGGSRTRAAALIATAAAALCAAVDGRAVDDAGFPA